MKKKMLLKCLVLSIASFVGFSSILTFFSLGTQNKISSLENDIIDQANIDENGVNFKIYRSNGGRIESVYNDKILNSLRNQTYSYALASRYITSNFYLSFSYMDLVLDEDIALLESQEKSNDNDNFVLQGTLDSLAAERVLDETTNMYTNYYYLSHSNDAIYLPDYLADLVLERFDLKNYNEIIYSSSEEEQTTTNVQVTLKSKLDDSFSLDCKLRGVYDSSTSAAKKIKLLNYQENVAVAVCSPGIFNNISFAEDGLFCLVKHHSENPNISQYSRFFNILETIFNNDLIIDFDCNANASTSDYLSYLLDTTENSSFFSLYWIYLVIGSLLTASYCAGLFIFLRKKKLSTFFVLTIIIVSYILAFLFLDILPIPIIIPSTLSLYYSLIVLFISILLSFLLTYNFDKLVFKKEINLPIKEEIKL